MSKIIYKSVVLLAFAFLTAFSAAPGFAQQNAAGKNPFTDGETLAYEGKFSKIIKGITVLDLNFHIDKTQNEKNYLATADAKSKGTLIKLFRFSFIQEIASTIDGTGDFRALKTVKHDVQKDRVRDSEAVFDYRKNNVSYTEIDPKQSSRPPRRIASEIKGETHDIVSAIYALRRLPLAVGKSFTLNVSDSGLVYKIPVSVTKREMQKTVLGKTWCFRLEPLIFGDQRFIERDGSMIIWITDDARRIPVRSQINTDIGRVEIKLKSLSYRRGQL